VQLKLPSGESDGVEIRKRAEAGLSRVGLTLTEVPVEVNPVRAASLGGAAGAVRSPALGS
jgi:hypothetical protein